MKIAFLGLGAMGSRMAARLIDAGHELTVWNRTAAATAPLAEKGAGVAASPADAAKDADIIISMVRDDDASARVWFASDGALTSMGEKAVGIECSTLSVPFVRELAGHFDGARRAFLDVPLAGSRPQAVAGQLIFLAGGDAGVLDPVRPVLETMGGAVHHAGAHGAGAVVKLMVNALFGTQLALVGELIGFAAKSGVDPVRAVEILGATPVVSPAAKLAAGAMLAGQFAPAFPIDLVAKDYGLLAASAEAAG